MIKQNWFSIHFFHRTLAGGIVCWLRVCVCECRTIKWQSCEKFAGISLEVRCVIDFNGNEMAVVQHHLLNVITWLTCLS